MLIVHSSKLYMTPASTEESTHVLKGQLVTNSEQHRHVVIKARSNRPCVQSRSSKCNLKRHPGCQNKLTRIEMKAARCTIYLPQYLYLECFSNRQTLVSPLHATYCNIWRTIGIISSTQKQWSVSSKQLQMYLPHVKRAKTHADVELTHNSSLFTGRRYEGSKTQTRPQLIFVWTGETL